MNPKNHPGFETLQRNCGIRHGHQCIRSQPVLYRKLSAGMASEARSMGNSRHLNSAPNITKPSKLDMLGVGKDWRIQCYSLPNMLTVA